MILHDERRDLDVTVDGAAARLGRDPTLDIAFDPDDDVVSAVHARVWREADGSWWLEDLGSTNGTWLNGGRIAGAQPLHTGDRFTLGQRGPALKVRIPGEVARTKREAAVDLAQPRLKLRRVAGGEDLLAVGREIVLGRAATCTITLRTVSDTVVSKRQAQVVFAEGDAATITDLGSKNGTFINGQRITGAQALKLGDRIMLGWHGPLFEIRTLGTASLPEGQGAKYRPELQPPKTLAGMLQVARGEARAPGGARVAAWLRAMARQANRESSALFRVVALASIVVLGTGLVVVYRSASRSSAAAQARLASAERAFAAQLKSSGEAQLRAQSEIARLRGEVEAARRASVPRAVVDSLEAQLKAAETRATASSRAEAAADFTRVAAENQAAVGLVIVRYSQTDSVMGTGFVITPSGYLLTSGHVVQDASRGRPRAIEIVMADTRTPLTADFIAASNLRDQDVAVLKIRNYRGAVVRKIDWQGQGVQQGALAALIGFPRGTLLAFDAAGFVRTTMFAGIVAKATSEWIQFGGPTAAGSSGSPVFNAAGEVIGLHYGALSDPGIGVGTPGLGFAIPIGRARRWLPPDARAELGL